MERYLPKSIPQPSLPAQPGVRRPAIGPCPNQPVYCGFILLLSHFCHIYLTRCGIIERVPWPQASPMQTGYRRTVARSPHSAGDLRPGLAVVIVSTQARRTARYLKSQQMPVHCRTVQRTISPTLNLGRVGQGRTPVPLARLPASMVRFSAVSVPMSPCP